MKVIIGSGDTGKSTILLHFVYNEIAKLIDANTASVSQANALTSQQLLKSEQSQQEKTTQ